MLEEAAMKGFYHSPLGKDYPRLQILTINDVFNGKLPDIPPWIAPRTDESLPDYAARLAETIAPLS